MCECSEKNFWISVGVFALIWGISVQYPFVIDPEIEVPELIHIDAFAKISNLEDWNSWQNVYHVNITDAVDTGSFFNIADTRLPFPPMEVRILNNDDREESLCWTWEQISPIMSAYHCLNVTKVGEGEYGHAKLLNHQIFYGPLSLFLHLYSWTLEQDAIDFNNQFKKAADEYA
mmetsp:Transcript_3783/g.6151  ORF Transcript_3783/g.6151 Transcript_3783/m.6151 type:complete len:174 (-) Transcript_3783:347-868(-)